MNTCKSLKKHAHAVIQRFIETRTPPTKGKINQE